MDENKVIDGVENVIDTAVSVPNQVIDTIDSVESSGLNFKVIGGVVLGTVVAAIAGIKIKKLIKKHKENKLEDGDAEVSIFDFYSDEEITTAAEAIKNYNEVKEDSVEEDPVKEEIEKK